MLLEAHRGAQRLDAHSRSKGDDGGGVLRPGDRVEGGYSRVQEVMSGRAEKVSVAVATYNGSEFLREQLNSLVDQTLIPGEVVIADDGSIDDSVEVVEAFARTAPFAVKVLRAERNSGYVRNFNKALSFCGGDVVFLCDQDDVWLPRKIERMLEVLAEHPDAVLAIHDLEFCREDLSPIGQTKIERIQSGQDVQRDYVTGMATAIKGDFLRLCLPIPDLPELTHDRWLHECALAVDGKIIVNEVLALYRRHATNVAATRAVNAHDVTNRWTFWWRRFREPLRLKMLECVPPSPLAAWLTDRREALIAGGYLEPEEVEPLIARENARTDVMRERHRLLQLPRWQRLPHVVRIYMSGKRYSWRNAMYDVIKS